MSTRELFQEPDDDLGGCAGVMLAGLVGLVLWALILGAVLWVVLT